jgi:hypothetical protein
MADRLGYVEPRRPYDPWAIAWFSDDFGEGAHIGEHYSSSLDEPDREQAADAWESWTVAKAAVQFATRKSIGTSGGFEFENQATARKAMAAIKVALKAKRSLNEHETWCLAQGWKPPKGWTGNVEEGKAT